MSRGRRLPLGPYMTAKVNLQRAYEPPDTDGGRRFLVDRLWPRGVARKNLALDAWVKDCLLYTSDAADERSSVDLGGRRIIKKTKKILKVGSRGSSENIAY